MILPVFVLGIAAAASTARYQRSALIEVMNQDYIRTARAKGLSERSVIWKHAMRNSLLPVITLIGSQPALPRVGCRHHGDDLLVAGHGARGDRGDPRAATCSSSRGSP